MTTRPAAGAAKSALSPTSSTRAAHRPARRTTDPIGSRAGSIADSLLADVLPELHARHGIVASEPEEAAPLAVAVDERAPVIRIPERAVADRWSDEADEEAEAREIDAALVATDGAMWERVLKRVEAAMRAGRTRRALREGLLAPAARRLGTAWTEDGASFVDVTIGTARLVEALDRLPGRVRDGAGPRVVLAPIPGDGHVFGLSLLGETLREGGFRVEVLTRPSAAAVGRAVARGGADVLGIGVPVARHAGRAAMIVRAVRAATREGAMPLVVAGGAAASKSAALLRASGVDEVMVGAGDPAAWLGERLEERSRPGGRPEHFAVHRTCDLSGKTSGKVLEAAARP